MPAAAAAAAPPGARPTKRRRTRKARLRTNADDSSSSSSSSSSSDADSDADSGNGPEPLPARRSSSDSSAGSSSDSDSDSSSSSSSSASSSSAGAASAPERARAPAQRQPLPDQQTALAGYMAQGPPPQRRALSGPYQPDEHPNRREEKQMERQQRLREQEERRANMRRFTPSPLPSDEDSGDEALDALVLARHDGGAGAGAGAPAATGTAAATARVRALRLERARTRAERILGHNIPDPVWAATGGEALAAALVPQNLGLPPLPAPAEEARTRAAAAAQRASTHKRQQPAAAAQPATTSSALAGPAASWDTLLGQHPSQAQPQQQDMLADIWMRSVADQFGDELNAIRERDTALVSEPERLPLLIDSLRAGADALVFTGTGSDALHTVLEAHKQWELGRATDAQATAEAQGQDAAGIPAETNMPPMPDVDIDMAF